jgi:predicted ATPase
MTRRRTGPWGCATALTSAQALGFAAMVHQWRREVLAVHAQAAAAMTLTTEQGFAQWLARGTVLHGWVLAMQDQGEAGIAEIRQGLAAELATGSTLWRPYCLGLLAEAYGAGGHPDEAPVYEWFTEGFDTADLQEAQALLEELSQ